MNIDEAWAAALAETEAINGKVVFLGEEEQRMRRALRSMDGMSIAQMDRMLRAIIVSHAEETGLFAGGRLEKLGGLLFELRDLLIRSLKVQPTPKDATVKMNAGPWVVDVTCDSDIDASLADVTWTPAGLGSVQWHSVVGLARRPRLMLKGRWLRSKA